MTDATSETATEARENRVPPVLRRWAQEQGAEVVERFNNENETFTRGVVVSFPEHKSVNLKNTPDAWEVGRVAERRHFGGLRVQFREVRL